MLIEKKETIEEVKKIIETLQFQKEKKVEEKL